MAISRRHLLVASLALFALGLFSVRAQTDVASAVPVLMWSGQSYFNGQNLVDSEDRSTDQVFQLLASLLNKDQELETPGLSQHVSGSLDDQPEVVVCFTHDKVSPSTLARYSDSVDQLAFLKSMMESSMSSLSIPFASFERPMHRFLIEYSVQHMPQSQIVHYSDEDIANADNLRRFESFADVLDYFEQDKSLFSNGVPDVLAVSLGDLEDGSDDQAKILQILTEMVHAATNGNYIAVYTSEEPDTDVQTTFPEAVQFNGRRMLQESTSSTAHLGPHHVNAPALTAIGVVAILLLIAFCGFGCLSSIATPHGFMKEKLAVGKEY